MAKSSAAPQGCRSTSELCTLGKHMGPPWTPPDPLVPLAGSCHARAECSIQPLLSLQPESRPGAERWRGGFLLHGAGRGRGRADGRALQPHSGLSHLLGASRLSRPRGSSAASAADPRPGPGLPLQPPGPPRPLPRPHRPRVPGEGHRGAAGTGMEAGLLRPLITLSDRSCVLSLQGCRTPPRPPPVSPTVPTPPPPKPPAVPR